MEVIPSPSEYQGLGNSDKEKNKEKSHENFQLRVKKVLDEPPPATQAPVLVPVR